MAHLLEPIASAVPDMLREEAGGSRLVHLDWVGATSATYAGAFGVRQQQIVLSALPGRRAGSVFQID